MGWLPRGDRSNVARRRKPKPMPGSLRKPSSSGPRWVSTAVIWRTSVSETSRSPSRLIRPQIPHIFLFFLCQFIYNNDRERNRLTKNRDENLLSVQKWQARSRNRVPLREL